MMHCAKPIYSSALKKCEKVAETFDKLDDYYTKWESQPDAAKIERKNYEANKDLVDKDYGYIEKQWKNGVFFDAGMFSGQV